MRSDFKASSRKIILFAFFMIILLVVAGPRWTVRCWFNELWEFGFNRFLFIFGCPEYLMCILFLIVLLLSKWSIFVDLAEIILLNLIFPFDHLLIFLSCWIYQLLYLKRVSLTTHISQLYSTLYFFINLLRNPSWLTRRGTLTWFLLFFNFYPLSNLRALITLMILSVKLLQAFRSIIYHSIIAMLSIFKMIISWFFIAIYWLTFIGILILAAKITSYCFAIHI